METIPSDNIHCVFGDKSMELSVSDLDGKDYVLTINKLLYKINPEKSSWKVKSGKNLQIYRKHNIMLTFNSIRHGYCVCCQNKPRQLVTCYGN